MYQYFHSVRQQHGFYVIDVITGSVVQYQSRPVVESTLGLDDLSTGPESLMKTDTPDPALSYPAEHIQSGG